MSQKKKKIHVFGYLLLKKLSFMYTHVQRVSQVSNTDVYVGLPTSVIKASLSLTKPQHLQQ